MTTHPKLLENHFDPGTGLQEATVDMFKWIQLAYSDVLIQGMW
jgi:hypothetical protein